MKKIKKLAFGLPEVLVCIVAFAVLATTAGVVISNEVAERKMNDAKQFFQNDIALTLADMQAKGELTGKGQEEVVKMIEEQLNLTEVKDEDIPNAFPKSYIDGTPGTQDDDSTGNGTGNGSAKTYDGKDITLLTPYKMIVDGKETELKNRLCSDTGICVAFTYDENCKVNNQYSQDASTFSAENNTYSYIAKNEALSCITGFYDVNGAEGPNKIGKDVKLFTEFKKECENPNFIPDELGRCPEDSGLFDQNFCTLTEINCQANGSQRILDKESCSCVCKLSCPAGQILDKESCTCKCDTESLLKQVGCPSNPYADCKSTENTCQVVCSCDAKQKCEKNGGKWNETKCQCDCTDVIKNVEKNYFGYAEVDDNNFCEVKCKYTSATDAFKSQVGKNANNNGEKEDVQKVAKSITLPGTLATKCYRCGKSTEENKTVINSNLGYCKQSCKEVSEADRKAAGNYYAFDNKTCKWVCNEENLQKLADKLNNDHGYMVKFNTKDIVKEENNKPVITIAKEEYFKAAAIGYAQVKKPAERSRNDYTNDPTLDKQVVHWYTRCTECKDIFTNFNSSQREFVRFLYYANNENENPSWTTKLFNYITDVKTGGKLMNQFNIARNQQCKIDVSGLTAIPSHPSKISFHGSNVSGDSHLIRATYKFEIKSKGINDTKLTDPTLPKKDGKYQTRTVYTNTTYKNLIKDVAVTRTAVYDPLALNVRDKANAMAAPEHMGDTTQFAIHAKCTNGVCQYSNKEVTFPANNEYQFIVTEAFKTQKNAGNMMNDTEEFYNGYARLAWYDSTENHGNNNGLVEGSELNGLYLWDRANNSYKPLSEYVFDINTNYFTIDGSSNDKISYSIQGYYRRLVPLTGKPETCAGTCLVFAGREVKADKSTYETWKELNGENTYLLKPINTTYNQYQYQLNTGWQNGTPTNPVFYYNSDNKWYEVILSKSSDIIFKTK